jgi:hypothetical protein
MADRQEFQQERSRLLRDPEAGDDTPIEDAAGENYIEPSTDAIEADRAANPQDFEAPAKRPEVEVTAAIIDEGIAITFIVPHALIGVALSE